MADQRDLISPSVWPIGYGHVMPGAALREDDAGEFQVKARADDQVMERGDAVPEGEWDRYPDAPMLRLVFKDAASVRQVVGQLERLADVMEGAMVRSDYNCDFAVKQCTADDWEGCVPGWYWGDVHEADGGLVVLGDSVGPFDTPGEAARDMANTLEAKDED